MNGLEEKAPIERHKIIILILGGLLLIVFVVLAVYLFRTEKIRELASLNQAEIDSRVKQEADRIQADFDAKLAVALQEELQKPFSTYTARDFYGAFEFQYPRFYHFYAEDEPTGRDQLLLYIDPDILVMSGAEKMTPFFHLIVRNRSFEDELEDMNRRTGASAIPLSDVVVSGISGKAGAGVLERDDPESRFIFLPFRDKTMYLITYEPTTVLPNGRTHSSMFDEMIKTFNLRK